MKNLIFPYETLGNLLVLSITDAALHVVSLGVEDEKSLAQSVDRQMRSVNLFQVNEKEWYAVTLRATIEGEREELESYMQSNGELTVLASAYCRYSHLRKSFELTRSTTNPYLWQGEITLDRREMFGAVKIMGLVSAKAGGRDHRFVSETNAWTLYLDSSYMPEISGSIPVRWIDFTSNVDYGNLKKYANEPYYLNLESPVPELYLNKSFSGLPELFPENSRPTGSQLAVHETFRTALAKSVWQSLLHAAIEAVIPGDGDEAPSLPDADWQQSVLKYILPKLYPGFSLDSALVRVAEDLKQGDVRQLETLASAVIGQEVARLGKGLRTAVQNLDLEYGRSE